MLVCKVLGQASISNMPTLLKRYIIQAFEELLDEINAQRDPDNPETREYIIKTNYEMLHIDSITDAFFSLAPQSQIIIY